MAKLVQALGMTKKTGTKKQSPAGRETEGDRRLRVNAKFTSSPVHLFTCSQIGVFFGRIKTRAVFGGK
ncbi:MAG: hypothetical protein ACI3YA_02445 [Alloprevotella sp.]